MKVHEIMKYVVLAICLASLSYAQQGEEEVPLMRPDEKKQVEAQSDEFNEALSDVLGDASKSTVRIWGTRGRRAEPELIAYGTVVTDGTKVLTKWSEVEKSIGTLYIQAGNDKSYEAEVSGVFTEEDLVLLELVTADETPTLTPAKFHISQLSYGQFLTAPQPTGKPGGFGVVSVLERNLRETNQAHLGVGADRAYQGTGVRISSVQPGYGAEEAGIRTGDVILAIGERRISGLQELRNALANKQPGDTVEILVEAAGKERKIQVRLSNKPLSGQFSGDRLNTMERMGGDLSLVRDGFSRVIQSDMKIKKNQVGGPIVNLDGQIVGVTLARADRTRTYIMSSKTIVDLLEKDTDTVAQAQEKSELKRKELASQRRAMLPQARPQGKPKDLDRMKRNLSDLERLLGRANNELDALDVERAP